MKETNFTMNKVYKNFFLPENYQENKTNITLDQNETFYWDADRVKRSYLHQFAVYKWAEKIIRHNNVQTVMDVGCGFAAKLEWLSKKCPQCSFYGIDQPNAVKLCEEKYSFGKWMGVDFENNPRVPEIKADLAISSDVIEHLENPDLLLEYLKRVVKPGGFILISTPERALLRGENCLRSPNPYHVREWDKKELGQYIQSHDFDILEHRVLPAIRFNLSKFYLQKGLNRWGRGKSMKYNQAVLIKARD